MRILVIDKRNFTDSRRLLVRMHKLRHRVFVDSLGWRQLSKPNSLERDRYDGPDATYLLAVDDTGGVRGSLRLLPTTRPHLLTDVFQGFLNQAAPQGPDVWEWSRHCPGSPDFPPAVTEAARRALHVGLCEWALARGVAGLVAIMDVALARRAKLFGWPCLPLGPVTAFPEGRAQAVWNPVDAARLQALRRFTGIEAPLLAAA